MLTYPAITTLVNAIEILKQQQLAEVVSILVFNVSLLFPLLFPLPRCWLLVALLVPA
jgi:hypothetical protein